MTSEEMERAIEFLLDHHSKVSADIERHSEQIGQLTADVRVLAQATASTQAQLGSVISEMREGFNNLIVANEVSRSLAEEATKLAIQTSQRVTGLDRRVIDLESQQ
jgi:tRNA A-37 threonylcarbamoyl transferase component Bud32